MRLTYGFYMSIVESELENQHDYLRQLASLPDAHRLKIYRISYIYIYIFLIIKYKKF